MHSRQTDLGGPEWELGAVHDTLVRAVDSPDIATVEEWIQATVPGNVRTDLLAAGLIADPFVGTNNEQSQWVEEHDWWYRRVFPLTLNENERAFLVFDGIDYLSAVHIDGVLLGTHEGMFSRQTYEITTHVRGSSTHHLTVRLVGPAHFAARELNPFERAWDRLSRYLSPRNSAFPERLNTLKCQMGFGWDFAPRMRTIGIWDAVTLIVAGTVWIRDVRVRTAVEADRAKLMVTARLDSGTNEPVSVLIELRESDGKAVLSSGVVDTRLHAGQQDIETTLTLRNPNLWQPWDRGTPHLYEITVRVVRGDSTDDSILDSLTKSFGIRDISIIRPPDTPSECEPWLLTVNGKPEFVRGANWVPLDAMPGRLRAGEYEQMVDQAINAGINMLRVWGGGLREKAAFYEGCDRKGMLVWQEFPFACVFLGYFRRDPDFLALVRQECTAIVRQLRNHPSVALWCGGNEFSPRRNRPLIDLLQTISTEEDGTRPFKRVSPDRHENHNWRVWHGRRPISDYRREDAYVLGEFGLQSVPDEDSLRKFIPAASTWPPGPDWMYHNGGIEKLAQYANPLLPAGTNSLREFIAASQQAQAHGLQVAVEHMRRRKGRTAGVLVWQLNEPWPSICWSLIDYYRRPKAAYRKLVDVYSPILLSALYPLRRYEPGDQLSVELWAINDRLEPIKRAEGEAVLDGETIFRSAFSLPADCSQRVGHTVHVLDHAPHTLSLRLTRPSGEILSSNEYDLTYVESHRLHWHPYLNSRLVELLMRW